MTGEDPEEDTRPEWMRLRYPRHVPQLRAVPTVAPGQAPAYAQAALEGEVHTLASTPEGRRNEQLNIAAFKLAGLIASGHLDRDVVHNALHSTALSIGLEEKETTDTLRSGLGAGVQHPRVVPDLAEAAVSPAVTTYAMGQAVDEETEEEIRESILSKFRILDWRKLWADDTQEEWIVYPVLPARRLVALFSPPKVGKSLLMLELAVAIASGVEVLGHTPPADQVVLYVDFENDPRGDIRTRLQAMGKTPEDLENLKYLSYPDLAKLDTPQGGVELMAIARAYGATVVVIDTISRAVGGEENANDTWLAFYRNTGLLLKAAGISVIRLDHTGKDESKGMRGGSAKYGDVDAVWSLTRLAESTFRLECTDARLPIGEKIMVLERKPDPLRHEWTPKRIGDVVSDEADRIVEALDLLDVPVEWGYDRARAVLLESAVPCPQAALKEALRRRKDPTRGHPQLTEYTP